MRIAVLLAVLLTTGCSGSTILSEEDSRAKLAQHRKAYEWLATEVRACGLDHIEASGDASEQCLGGVDKARLQTAMQTLGVKSASRHNGDLLLKTGTDGSEVFGMDLSVASYMIQSLEPEPNRPYPLTATPHHWFYSQHD